MSLSCPGRSRIERHAACGRRGSTGNQRTDRTRPYDSSKSERLYIFEQFAVWCPHCQHEVTLLNELQQVDGARIDIIAVPASPFSFGKISMIQSADRDLFARRFHTLYRIGFDGFFSLAYDYGVASFPTFYSVHADRRVVAVEAGEVPFEELHADVAAMFGSSYVAASRPTTDLKER